MSTSRCRTNFFTLASVSAGCSRTELSQPSQHKKTGWPSIITLTGGPAPARAYIETLMPAILDGTVQPGKVFDRTVGLDGVPDGYRAMADRDALKVLVKP